MYTYRDILLSFFFCYKNKHFIPYMQRLCRFSATMYLTLKLAHEVNHGYIDLNKKKDLFHNHPPLLA